MGDGVIGNTSGFGPDIPGSSPGLPANPQKEDVMSLPETLLESVKGALQENQFLTGGGILMLIAGLIAAMRKVPEKLFVFVQTQATVTTHLHNDGEVYHWVKYWFSKHPYMRKSRRVVVQDRLSKSGIRLGSTTGNVSSLGPAPGFHLLKFNGKRLLIKCVRGEPAADPSKSDFLVQESYTITYLGRNQSIIRDLVEEAYKLCFPDEDPRITVWGESWGSWNALSSPRHRSIDSVILPEGVAEDILADVQKFIGREDWYHERGIPYRRGYLLHGDPGTGKSSLVHALASELQKDVYIIRLDAKKDTVELAKAMGRVPNDAILLLEDIDCVMPSREASGENNVSMAALLNAIDGVCATEGRLLFMTTNHINRMDPALIRSGRVDRKIKFGPATEDQARRMFLRFFNDEEKKAAQFGRAVGDGVPMCDIQDHLVRNAECVEAATHWERTNEDAS